MRLPPSRGDEHADEVRLGPATREHLPRQCRGTFAVHSRGAKPRRAARFSQRPIDYARKEPRRDRMRDPDDVSASFSGGSALIPRSSECPRPRTERVALKAARPLVSWGPVVGNPDGKYLIKGGGPKVWKKFRVRKEHRRLEGIIHGKRCGTSQNLGPTARLSPNGCSGFGLVG